VKKAVIQRVAQRLSQPFDLSEADPHTGWVGDLGEIKRLWEPLDDALDHRYLNEVEGLENPTTEAVARWIYDRLRPVLPGLIEVELWETHRAHCRYRGENQC